MNILFLTHRFYPDVGGIEVNSEILADAFQRAGHRVRLMTWSRDGDHKRFSFELKRNPGFWELLQGHAWADIVYENNPCLRLAWPAMVLRKPGVVALRTWIRHKDGKLHWQEKCKLWWLKRARAVIAVSEAVRTGCWPSALVIGNPYRAEMFRILPNSKRDRCLVFLGRLVSDKGADLAIKALKNLLAMGVAKGEPLLATCSLTIIGDGPVRKTLQDLASQLGLSSRVFFTGNLTGDILVSCLNRHKYIVVPSIWEEPFGNVALEGMACGCIPVVSDGGGLPDAIGKAGLVFSSGDTDDLTHCIGTVILDSQLQHRLLEAAPAHLARHRPEAVANRYLDVLTRAKQSAAL